MVPMHTRPEPTRVILSELKKIKTENLFVICRYPKDNLIFLCERPKTAQQL